MERLTDADIEDAGVDQYGSQLPQHFGQNRPFNEWRAPRVHAPPMGLRANVLYPGDTRVDRVWDLPHRPLTDTLLQAHAAQEPFNQWTQRLSTQEERARWPPWPDTRPITGRRVGAPMGPHALAHGLRHTNYPGRPEPVLTGEYHTINDNFPHYLGGYPGFGPLIPTGSVVHVDDDGAVYAQFVRDNRLMDSVIGPYGYQHHYARSFAAPHRNIEYHPRYQRHTQGGSSFGHVRRYPHATNPDDQWLPIEVPQDVEDLDDDDDMPDVPFNEQILLD